MNVAVIGAGGFVGRAMVSKLRADGHEVIPIVRRATGLPGERQVSDLVDADWPGILDGAEAVIHLAARVHIMKDRAADPLGEFRRVNRDGALAAFRGAMKACVNRFVYVSTIKVNGEKSEPGRPFRADDPPSPEDAYGVSKNEAEKALTLLSQGAGTALCVVRPPLVHGPGVRANLRSMMAYLQRGLPLPLGAITHNRRSLVGLDNLTDLLALCARHPAAAGQTFLVSDGRDISTAELARLLSIGLGRKGRLPRIPLPLLSTAATLFGKRAAFDRLSESLQADINPTSSLLGWVPPVPLEEGLRRMTKNFRNNVD